MDIAGKISNKNRRHKFQVFMELFNPGVDDNILDIGANDEEYSENDNMLEKLYPYKKNITVLGLHSYKEFSNRYQDIKTITYDGKVFPFKDKEFEYGWSNAVLEHVGDFNKQVFFIKEITRTCKKAFITTPNRLFPVEVHTRIPLLHFLPKHIFDSILVIFNLKWASGDYMHLLTKRKLIKVLNAAGVKNYTIRCNRFMLFAMDFMVMITE